MGFWDLFQKKKDNNIKDENHINDETSEELVFAKNFTEAGGKFIYIDKGDSVIDTFTKIKEENQWDKNNVMSLSQALSKNLGIKKTKDVTENDDLKALVVECEYLLSNTGRMLISSNQIKNNKIDSLPDILIVIATSNQFVGDVSEGMTRLKAKYSKKFPTNITTINVRNKFIEDDFLSYGNSAKDIYLIISDE
ncbi:MAG: LUD domain-containing protein [Bacteroidota bacterium]|nr:LUD domain-containing protein [Bacteroidota bacterium]